MESKQSLKQKRLQERELLDDYHQFVTEEALEPLYQSFVEWKQGTLPYDELTDQIHVFHKKNQEIYKDFQYSAHSELLLLAKMKLDRLTEEDIIANRWILERWGYEDINLKD
ncbi:hypothetical protein GCM10008018_07050 [Paenibacillus marchantiophytorum]|uniref:Uncharacterized protein n=1 Tax=Paenibacillus marchantiophytorum TaxID=1619310 RepID=A0ABQ2BPB6_9BACL|nr:hypothetical protein [Paenibacillus marchantiophytorum]GGI44427.1 hypothetical protein GCM10008018_07050 [Paenibacillus marchantiophytorum]